MKVCVHFSPHNDIIPFSRHFLVEGRDGGHKATGGDVPLPVQSVEDSKLFHTHLIQYNTHI